MWAMIADSSPRDQLEPSICDAGNAADREHATGISWTAYMPHARKPGRYHDPEPLPECPRSIGDSPQHHVCRPRNEGRDEHSEEQLLADAPHDDYDQARRERWVGAQFGKALNRFASEQYPVEAHDDERRRDARGQPEQQRTAERASRLR